MGNKRISKQLQQQISLNRIHTLFQLAEVQAKQGRLYLADKYVHHARKISMKNRTPIPRELKYRFCKHCYHYFYPSVTCRYRLHHGKVIYYCSHCNQITRLPLKNKE